jgi:hypothetical protein
MYPTTPEFRKHCENFARVKAELRQIERVHKRSIRQGHETEISAVRRVHMLYVGVLAEAKLRMILTDPTGFNELEQAVIWGNAQQLTRWTGSVELALRRHYRIPIHEPLLANLGPDVAARAAQVLSLLSTDLKPVIEDRNKIAHGQWVWQLASREENHFKQTQQVFDDNYVVSTSKSELIETIGDLIHTLAVSKPTFVRDTNCN